MYQLYVRDREHWNDFSLYLNVPSKLLSVTVLAESWKVNNHSDKQGLFNDQRLVFVVLQVKSIVIQHGTRGDEIRPSMSRVSGAAWRRNICRNDDRAKTTNQSTTRYRLGRLDCHCQQEGGGGATERKTSNPLSHQSTEAAVGLIRPIHCSSSQPTSCAVQYAVPKSGAWKYRNHRNYRNYVWIS